MRQFHHAITVLQSLDEYIHLIAHFRRLIRVKFIGRNRPFTLVTNVHQHFLLADFDNLPRNNFLFSKAHSALLEGFFHSQHKL